MKLALLVAITPFLLACGGGKTTASKSAPAFDEAKNVGRALQPVPAAAAQPHAEADHSPMPPMDHSSMPAMDHSKTDHSKMNHAQMDHAQMDHAQMNHAQMSHAQTDDSQMDHSTMPGMHHAPPLPPLPPGEGARRAGEGPPSDPATTLRPDEFDAPAPSALGEAAKTATPPAHHHHGEGA